MTQLQIFDLQVVKKSKASLFLTGGGKDTDFLLKGKAEMERNLYVFPYSVIDMYILGHV